MTAVVAKRAMASDFKRPLMWVPPVSRWRAYRTAGQPYMSGRNGDPAAFRGRFLGQVETWFAPDLRGAPLAQNPALWHDAAKFLGREPHEETCWTGGIVGHGHDRCGRNLRGR